MFPSPHSGILFLSGTDIPAAESRTQSFRPLIRGFFFYDTDDNHECGYKFKHGFRPLIRGFFFYLKRLINAAALMFNGFPSPHSGILFLFSYTVYYQTVLHNVSVPSFGDSFFMVNKNADKPDKDCFRPLIRGFFFYTVVIRPTFSGKYCFRPLIRGFFFYNTAAFMFDGNGGKFPSPHSGILFLYKHGIECLISGLVFPSPHSGILFLFAGEQTGMVQRKTWFPSPHSGILFL